MDRRIDVFVAACFSLVGIIMIFAASGIKTGMMRDPIGPRAAFYVCGGILALGGIAVIVGHLRRWSSQKGHIVPSEGATMKRTIPRRRFGHGGLSLRSWGWRHFGIRWDF